MSKFVLMNEYVRQRMNNIERNRTELKKLGLHKAYSAMQDRAQNNKKSNSKKLRYEVDKEYEPYQEEDGINDSSGDENIHVNRDFISLNRPKRKARRCSNMSDVLAKEKQPMEMSRCTTRSQSEASRYCSKSRVASFQTPIDSISQWTEVFDNPSESGIPLNGNQFTGSIHNNMEERSENLRRPDGLHLMEQCENAVSEASDVAIDDVENISTKKKRKGRGSSLPWAEWNNGVKKILEWNENCQPVCSLGTKLSTQLGCYVKNGRMFPLTMLSWNKANETALSEIWDEVKTNTNAPDGFEPICKAKIGVAWKQWKHRVKVKYYLKYDTDEKRLENFPPGVERSQWPVLVQYWGLQEITEEAKINSKNREAECAYSRTGRTPHCKIVHERTKRGEPVDDITMWKTTRDPKNISFNIEDGSADRATMLERRLNELAQEDRENPEKRNRIFKEVVGQGGHGHCLLKGVGIKPMSTRTNASIKALSDENNRLKKEAEDREIRHKQELLKMKEEMKNEIYRVFESVGIDVPRRSVDTSESDSLEDDE